MDKRYIKGPGRYGSQQKQFYGKCDVRLDKKELMMLEELSKSRGVTKSDIMRRALKDFYRWNTEDGVNIE